MNKKLITSFIIFIFATSYQEKANAQVSPQEQIFAERVAMLSIDNKCHFFDGNERRAINAFMLQARGSLLRNGNSDARVGLIMKQAMGGIANKSCSDPLIVQEAARVKKAYKSWRMQMNASFAGTNRVWHASRAGLDNWRAWQDVGDGIRIGFVMAQNGLVFGVETPSLNVATMRVFWRDTKRLGPPKANMGLVAPPRMGTITQNATKLLPAVSKQRLDSPPRIGILALFPNDVTRSIVALDPRDCFEVEIVQKNGAISKYIVEVGDIIA
ncbi:MAG: hypothetical protein J0L55_15615, partial [Caulobacterales bacterium]|nr:hypothetical protein [Caulobacterales bacterium]